MANSLSPEQVPYTGPYALAGNKNGYPSKGPTCKALKRGLSRAGAPTLPWREFDDHYNQDLEDALDWMDLQTHVSGNNGYAEGRWERIRQLKTPNGEWALDGTAQKLIQDEAGSKPSGDLPNLGPVVKGGKSILDEDLTHATDGLPLFPAFDTAFGEAVSVFAPEDITVDTKKSSSHPGHAIYATGRSGMRYWFGHLDRDYALGVIIQKGGFIGLTCKNDIGGGPHCHVGVNGEAFLGKGEEFVHHTNYTHGAPTIREQLEGALL